VSKLVAFITETIPWAGPSGLLFKNIKEPTCAYPYIHTTCRSQMSQSFVLALYMYLQLAGLIQDHVVITYPGWKGNNLDRTDEFLF
jgi:hypothetical protein